MPEAEIYEPEEDSFLFSKVLKNEIPKLLKKNPELKFLEIGSGSGIQLKTLADCGIKKQNIFSCDVNSLAVKRCKSLGFQCIESNLFKNVKDKYDIIIFNSPYLPLDSKEPKTSRVSTTGGKLGGEIVNKFLKQAKKHLNKEGKIFLLTSSLTRNVDFLDYKKKKIAEKNLFFEKLFVWELRQ